MALVYCPHRLSLNCLVTRMCHHLESLAHVIVSVFISGACFFLSYPVCHMVEHGADMSDFPYMVSVYVCVILGSLCLLWHVLIATGRCDSAGHLHALCVYVL